jgi:acetyl esterase/lipase
VTTRHEAVIRSTPAEVTPELIQGMWELFARDHRERGYQAPVVVTGEPYGPDPRQRLDVHRASEPSPGAPVLLFAPGGGFVAGDKDNAGLPFYRHIGRWAADRGLVAVTMNYRLAPQHQWPAGAEDIADAVAWVRANIAEHGGDPERIVLAGHSAGAAHVAGYLAGHGGRRPEVAAAALLSGNYDQRDIRRNELLRS